MKSRQIVAVSAVILFSLLCLTSCGTLTENFGRMGGKPKYKHAETVEEELVLDPPRLKLDLYHSVQSEYRPWQNSDLAVAVAASGGGYRAANLTAGVLVGLEKITTPEMKANLLQEVDYFSTVSGGGFAVGLYLSQLLKHIIESDDSRPYNFGNTFLDKRERMYRKLRVNYSSDLFFGYRRSLNLEEKLSKNLLTIQEPRQLMLGDMFIPKSQPKEMVRLPMWVTNSTIIQNSQLFQFTPDVISKYRLSHYIHQRMVYRILDQQEDLYGFDIPAGVGMTASAAYPYAIAGSTLWSTACDDYCHLQLFDGGLVDNLGFFTVLDLLRQDPAKKKLLIIIDAFHGNREPFSESRHPPRKFELLQGLLNSPPNALQRNLKPYITTIAKDILCAAGAEQVVVAYVDLSEHTHVENIGTTLWISRPEQKQMFDIGKQLVRTNDQLNIDFPLMLRDANIATCPNMLYDGHFPKG